MSAASTAAQTTASRMSTAADAVTMPTTGHTAMNRSRSRALILSSRDVDARVVSSCSHVARTTSSTNSPLLWLSMATRVAYTGVLTGRFCTHSSTNSLAGSLSAGRSCARSPLRCFIISGEPSQWMMASRISWSSRLPATGPLLPTVGLKMPVRMWEPSYRPGCVGEGGIG